MKKIFKHILPLSLLTTCITPITTSCSCNNNLRLVRTDWEDQTKTALNQALEKYGKDGSDYSKDNYVVFDFDNTSAIFDIQSIGTTYQIERMTYNLSKAEFKLALEADLGVTTRSLIQYGYKFTYNDLISDIVDCYGNLITKYGPFSYKGVDESKLDSLHSDNDWIDFSAKLRYLYDVVSTVQGSTGRCKWQTYQLSGMSPQQVYEYEYACLVNKQKVKSSYQTWTAKTPIRNTTVIASASFIQGISVTDNIKELYKAIKNNGIDIWIISASQVDQVRAAADAFGLGDYVSGAFGVTNKLNDSGIYIPQYDDNGNGYSKKDNKWSKIDKPNPHFTSGVGKSQTIVNAIAPNYNNKGPIMCFGDSTGDFNFCSEFKDTKLVVCFNRADRSVKDGGGLMSAIAMYQKLNNITLALANANNDTLYCLQGRDDNNRVFRNSNKTIRLGEATEQLFLNNDNYSLLSYIMGNELTIAEACQLSLKTTILQDIQVGFLDTYAGYHSR